MKRLFQSADRRLVGAAVVSGLLLVPLGVFGSSAFARTAGPSAAQYQYKVTICHRTGSKKHPFHTITVSNKAVPAHLRHGDKLGACAASPTTATTSSHGNSSSHGPSTQSSSKPHGNNGNNGNNGNHGKS
jgi:hypothetical protein